MIIVALLIGFILIAAAIRNTQAELFAALGTDLPAYVVWAAALVAIGAVGFVPGLKAPSRALLALVIVVIVLINYSAILAGFAAVSGPPAAGAGGSAPASAGASPPVSTPAGAAAGAASASSAGANPFGTSPAASGFGAMLGQAFGSTASDAANSFAGMFTGTGP